MTTQDYAALPEELGLREVNEGKKILVTTFLLPRTVSKAALGALFRQRWHVELDLRAIKTTLQMADLSCNTPEMNEKGSLGAFSRVQLDPPADGPGGAKGGGASAHSELQAHAATVE